MQDRIFLDSNILVYCYSTTDVHKQDIGRKLSVKQNTYISTQVLNETTNVLSKKYKISWDELGNLISDFEFNFMVHRLSTNDIIKACQIADKYKFSFYDSLIISTAIACNCNILYTEDMHNNQIIEGKLKIINPFI